MAILYITYTCFNNKSISTYSSNQCLFRGKYMLSGVMIETMKFACSPKILQKIWWMHCKNPQYLLGKCFENYYRFLLSTGGENWTEHSKELKRKSNVYWSNIILIFFQACHYLNVPSHQCNWRSFICLRYLVKVNY